MPSRPAISMAENARYGLQDGSGGRNSRRLALGLAEYTGMRTAAERLRFEYARFTGASYPGTRRLYEFVPGAMMAESARACFNKPPAYQSAICDRPAYPSPANRGLPFFQSDWCVCMPEPLSEKTGFGINITVLPAFAAAFL